jgi:hypothetical protein
MPDNKKITHPLDAKRIDINDPAEVRNWTKALGVTEAKLREAVRKVGTSSTKVRKYLKK